MAVTNINAELYKDIAPLDSLGDIKAKLPNASYESVKAAWVTESDALYKITGHGLSGTIIVKFYDSRPYFKKMLQNTTEDQDNTALIELAGRSDDEALSVSWVRWVPDTMIPLDRFILKYGAAEESGFDDQDMSPYKAWTKRGLTAYLSDNGKYVIRVDYEFTITEQRKAWKERRGFIPEWLQIVESKSTKKTKK